MDRFIYSLLLLPSVLGLLTHEPPVPSATSRSTAPEERWFNARLNQFDASNTDTFPMRFYYNNQFTSPNSSSIVIYVGGEWEISAGWLRAGLAYELASQIQAGLFYTEHRYYGATRPTEETHPEDLRHLTVDQALADLAQFIQYIKSDLFENGVYKSSKVALVGCSYAGSMATWMRLAYPHLVDVAFSDSGPLHAQEDFPEYLEVISEALEVQGGESCRQAVQESMEALQQLIHSNGGPEMVSQLFRTCSPLQATPLDLATFFWFGITETFAYLVQYATPGDIPAACEVLTDASAEPVSRLANWITSRSWTYPCIESRYTEVVSAHRNTSYDAQQSVMRLWTYQTCVEYGWYQTTTSDRQPFLSTIPLGYFHQMCKDFFGNSFDEEFLRYGIERTNTMFGGLHLPDHVVSVVGGHDPWAPMGPSREHGRALAPVYVVPHVSHCRAVQPLESSESEELARTKRLVSNFMAERLTGEPVFQIDEEEDESSGNRAVASFVVVVIGLYLALPLESSESEELARTKRLVSNFMAERLTGEPVFQIDEEEDESSGNRAVASFVVVVIGLYLAL